MMPHMKEEEGSTTVHVLTGLRKLEGRGPQEAPKVMTPAMESMDIEVDEIQHE